MSDTKLITRDEKKSIFLTEGGEPRTWTLFYRYGNRATIEKNFFFDGNLLEARRRGIKHCEVMGYIFIFVRPFIVDLEYQEQMKLSGVYKDPDERQE